MKYIFFFILFLNSIVYKYVYVYGRAIEDKLSTVYLSKTNKFNIKDLSNLMIFG